MKELAILRQEVADLEARLEALRIRHSALEWIVELNFADHLLMYPPAEAAAFLEAIRTFGSQGSWWRTEEGYAPVRPDQAAAVQRDVEHILDKVAERMRIGERQAQKLGGG